MHPHASNWQIKTEEDIKNILFHISFPLKRIYWYRRYINIKEIGNALSYDTLYDSVGLLKNDRSISNIRMLSKELFK